MRTIRLSTGCPALVELALEPLRIRHLSAAATSVNFVGEVDVNVSGRCEKHDMKINILRTVLN